MTILELESRTTSLGPLEQEEQVDLVAERRVRHQRRLRRLATSVLGLVLAASLWELAALIISNPVFLPTVSSTFATFAHYLGRPYPTASMPLWEDVLVSTRRILVGFALGTAGGVLIGSLMHRARLIRELVDPIIELTRPLPPLAFIPLFIEWFGIGEMPKVVLIVVGVVPIMVVATLAALDSVPKELEQCARTLGASRSYALYRVQVRAALPGIVTGMRIAMAGSWTSIVAVEMIAATSGVGYLILQAGNYLQTGLVFSGIIAIGLMGLTLDACLRLVLRATDPSRR